MSEIKTPVTCKPFERLNIALFYDADGNAIRPQDIAKALNESTTLKAKNERLKAMLADADAVSFPNRPILVKMLDGEWGIRTTQTGGGSEEEEK